MEWGLDNCFWKYDPRIDLRIAHTCGVILRVKVKCSRYRTGVAQKVGTGIALLFRDNATPRPHFTPGKEPVAIVQEAEWAPGPIWTGGKSRPHRDSIPDRPACSQLLYRLSYRAHWHWQWNTEVKAKVKFSLRSTFFWDDSFLHTLGTAYLYPLTWPHGRSGRFWRRESSLATTGIRTQDRSLFVIPTALLWLLDNGPTLRTRPARFTCTPHTTQG